MAVDGATSSRDQFFRKQIPQLLVKLGYEEGKNIVFVFRHADGDAKRLPVLANELVGLGVELIIAFENGAVLAAKQATQTIPIVMATSAHPVLAGFVASYARPGGNITGIDWWPTPELAARRFQFLKLAVPRAKVAAMLWNPTMPSADLYRDEFENKVTAITGMKIAHVFMTRTDDLEDALAKIVMSRADVLSVGADPAIFPRYAQIAALATKQKLVSIGGIGYTGQGGLLTFGANLSATTERIADYIDRILRGTKPADLPVEQASKYELILNSKTAKAMGLTLSPVFMANVDQVVE